MSLVDTILGPIIAVINKVVPDTDLKTKLQAEMTQEVLKIQELEIEKASDVIIAEAKGESWMQRNWRPILMLGFGAIVLNNFLVAPYLQAFGLNGVVLDLPDGIWGLLQIGIGGYVAGRSLEKITETVTPAIHEALKPRPPAVPR